MFFSTADIVIVEYSPVIPSVHQSAQRAVKTKYNVRENTIRA